MNTVYPVDPKVDVVELLRPYFSTSKEGETYLDFNKIVGPMPESLYCHCTLYPKVSFGDGRTERNGDIQILPPTFDHEAAKRRMEKNREQHGFLSWYDWRIANWGTKWNSYDLRLPRRDESGVWSQVHEGSPCVFFSTASTSPMPIVAKLAQLTGVNLCLHAYEPGMGFEERFTAYADGQDSDYVYTSLDGCDSEGCQTSAS